MKQIGKVGKANIAANKKLNKEYKSRGLFHCEIGAFFKYQGVFADCWKIRQSYCHRLDRIEYRGDMEDLGKFEETIGGCIHCHTIIDKPENAELKEKLFVALRPKDKMAKKISIKCPQKKSSKKADWMREHKCVNCGRLVSSLICSSCGEWSMKR